MEKKVVAAMQKAGAPVKAGEIAKALGVENKEVSKVFQELKKQGKIVSPKRCFYALAD
jgi:Mn-dependent DtxR family transcriptional regulator